MRTGLPRSVQGQRKFRGYPRIGSIHGYDLQGFSGSNVDSGHGDNLEHRAWMTSCFVKPSSSPSTGTVLKPAAGTAALRLDQARDQALTDLSVAFSVRFGALGFALKGLDGRQQL
jgi:hypothetical protein